MRHICKRCLLLLLLSPVLTLQHCQVSLHLSPLPALQERPLGPQRSYLVRTNHGYGKCGRAVRRALKGISKSGCRLLRHPHFSDAARIPTFVASVLRSMMGSAHSPRWGEPILSRRVDVEFGGSRGSQPLAAMSRWLAGAIVSSLVVFCHGISALTGVRLDTTPNSLASTCQPLAQQKSIDSCLRAAFRAGASRSA